MTTGILLAIEQLLDSKLRKVCPEYLDSQDACVFLGISKACLYKKNLQKAIPYYKPNGSKKVYYKRSDLIAYLTANRLLSKDEIGKEATEFFTHKNGGAYV